MTPVSNTTVRMIARVTIAGDSVRLRFDNTYGTAPLQLGKVTVGWRKNGASLAAGSNRPVSFKGSPGTTAFRPGELGRERYRVTSRSLPSRISR